MPPIDIFIAYSHEDLSAKNELKKFLAPMLRERIISLWDDFDIEGGQDWDAEIKQRLYSADIVLLLLSADSLASSYFYGQEVEESLKRHARGEAKVIPIILRHCDWEPTPLGALEALPEKGRPIVDWPVKDQAFKDIVSKLRRIVEGVQKIKVQASEQALAHQQFQGALMAAEQLFGKKHWEEARKAYKEALNGYRPGFSPDKQALLKQVQEVDRLEKQEAEARKKAEAAQRGQEKAEQEAAARQQQEVAERQRQEQLAAAYQRENDAWTDALNANTLEEFQSFMAQFPQSRYLREARQYAKTLRADKGAGHEPTGSSNRVVFAALGLVFILAAAIWLWRKGNTGGSAKDTEATDYAAAKAAGTLLALDTFINKQYPEEKFTQEARADYAALKQRYAAQIKDAKALLEDSPEQAKKHLDTALTIIPNDAEALRLQKMLK